MVGLAENKAARTSLAETWAKLGNYQILLKVEEGEGGGTPNLVKDQTIIHRN